MKKIIFSLLIVFCLCGSSSAQYSQSPKGTSSGSGNVATDTIFDAAGDLIQGSGANAGERLAVGTAYQVLHSNGTKATWTSTLGATGTRLTYGYFIDLVVTNAIQGSITGNAATATNLAADPADCAAGQVATGIAASGALSCTATPSVTTLTGNVTGNCSGTAGGLSGTPNITVGTISAGATGFSVDADGDVTAKSISTGGSADPTITLNDTDNAAGTAKIFGNSSGGANDIIMQIGVEDSSGENTVYMELDGVTETVDLIKPVVLSSTLTGNVTGNCSGTAGGLSGTPNITVGTISAGATGFSVDADGDVTAKSYSTGPSTDPTINLSDSDNAAGTAKIFGSSGGGTNDIIMQLGVEDSSGESTVYLELDGVTETVDLIKPVVLSSTLSGGGVILGDSTPDAAGELGYASNQLSVYDGTASRSLLQVASTIITKSELIPISYMEEDDSVTAPAAIAEIGTSTMVARSFAEDADNGLIIWWHVPLDYYAGIKYRVYYATDTNAGADETAAFSMAGCSVGNLDAIACSEGTAVVVTDELTADYDTEELIVTEWSTAVTVTDITAGELSKLLFIRDVSEDDMVGHALVAYIEIKYQAKINASMDY
jgi:hypothetical protein